MTAWEELTKNSSLTSGTAWDHLLAQDGGGEVKALYVEVAEAYLIESANDAAIELNAIESLLVDSILQADINDEVISTSLQSISLASESIDLALSLSLSDSTLSATLLEETI